jgi:hypothetical protein
VSLADNTVVSLAEIRDTCFDAPLESFTIAKKEKGKGSRERADDDRKTVSPLA